MYYAQSFVGKIVTLRTSSGEEIITELLGVDPDNRLITVKNPRIVAVNNQEVVLMPYVITAGTLSVTIEGNSLISILETAENTAAEYQAMVSEEAVSEAAA